MHTRCNDRNDLGFDSIDAVELSIELDKEFGIDIKDDDFYQMLDDSCLLTHVYDMVEDYVKKKG